MIAHETELRSTINKTFHVKHQLGARKIIGQYLKVFMKRKLSLIYLNERSKITTMAISSFLISHARRS